MSEHSEFEYVPLMDTATYWPGLLWWDVKARENREQTE